MWTDTRVELLKKLWADGLSAAQIANELGGVTRNGVIGKVHRLGLSGRARPSSLSSWPRKARSTKHVSHVPRSRFRGNTALAFEYEPVPEPELIEIPVEQRKTLLQINEHTCRWPVGDPAKVDFFFCGGKTVPGTLGNGSGASPIPYCAYHCRMAYTAPVERQRDRFQSKPASVFVAQAVA